MDLYQDSKIDLNGLSVLHIILNCIRVLWVVLDCFRLLEIPWIYTKILD